MIRNLVSLGMVLILMGGVPLLSFLTARRPEIRQIPRLDLYLSAVLSQWLLVALVIPAAWLAGPGFGPMGFRSTASSHFLGWAAALIGISLALIGLEITLEHFGLWPEESDLVRLLIPATRVEKLMAAWVVAPTAAFCEELLYRGYLFTLLSRWFESAEWALLIAAATFGLAHFYQGARGIVRTALLGALLTVPVMRLGSLYPSMAVHFVIDALAMAWVGPRFLRPRRHN